MAVRVMNESTEIKEMARVMALAPTANSLDDIFIAPTAFADGVSFKQTGREIVTVKNTDAGPQTFTLKGVASEAFLNRVGDVGPYSLAAGESATFVLAPNGFKTSQGVVTVVMSANTVVVAVHRAPSLVA